MKQIVTSGQKLRFPVDNHEIPLGAVDCQGVHLVCIFTIRLEPEVYLARLHPCPAPGGQNPIDHFWIGTFPHRLTGDKQLGIPVGWRTGQKRFPTFIDGHSQGVDETIFLGLEHPVSRLIWVRTILEGCFGEQHRQCNRLTTVLDWHTESVDGKVLVTGNRLETRPSRHVPFESGYLSHPAQRSTQHQGRGNGDTVLVNGGLVVTSR